MSTVSSHTYFDQEITITSNNDVILKLHDPRSDSKQELPIFKCDLSAFLNGLAFLTMNQVDAKQFMKHFNRVPVIDFCKGCKYLLDIEDYGLKCGSSYANVYECPRLTETVIETVIETKTETTETVTR